MSDSVTGLQRQSSAFQNLPLILPTMQLKPLSDTIYEWERLADPRLNYGQAVMSDSTFTVTQVWHLISLDWIKKNCWSFGAGPEHRMETGKTSSVWGSSALISSSRLFTDLISSNHKVHLAAALQQWTIMTCYCSSDLLLLFDDVSL